MTVDIKRSSSHPPGLARWIHGLWSLAVFLLLGLVALLGVLLLPRLSWRRAAARSMARLFFALTLMRVHLAGLERLPAGACVVVANHASYLDGPLMQALLPPRFAFVIKGEMAAVPVAGLLLRRLGSQFVDRQNRHRGGRDTQRILDLALGGNALGFFPEGTFHGPPGLHRFQPGAFVTAARAGLPVVPVVIRGTRQALGEGQWLPAAARIEVEILDAMPPPVDEREAIQAARDAARAAILARLGEPDADLRRPSGTADAGAA